MSVQFAGSRSPDDRRRRRLAVAGDVPGLEAETDGGGLGRLRERLGAIPAASPWLPRETWKRSLIAAAFWIGLSLVGFMLVRPIAPHPQLAPAMDHLALGSRPVLSVYTEILLWTFAGQFAALVGWYRSQSELDFRGRYRLWAWAALVLTVWGFCAGTEVHTAIAAIAGPRLRWPLWRAETVVWLVPAALAGLSVWWMADRDMRRCRLGVNLLRAAGVTLFASGIAHLIQADFASSNWFPAALLLSHYLGAGLLMTALWVQAWYVAYVSADPPEAAEPVDWRGRSIAMLGAARILWPFRKRAAAVAETKPKRRTKKKTDEEEEDEETAPKRRRKAAAKPKRVSKPRTRVKPEPEEVEEEEYAEEETWEETDETTASDDEWTEESESYESYEEEAEEEVEPPPPPVRTAAKSPPPSNKPAPAPPKREPVQEASRDDEDEEEDNGAYYRVDGAEGGSDPYKGLSKRQRRELRKQAKDQQRGNGR